jgi:hypothetical protein
VGEVKTPTSHPGGGETGGREYVGKSKKERVADKMEERSTFATLIRVVLPQNPEKTSTVYPTQKHVH